MINFWQLFWTKWENVKAHNKEIYTSFFLDTVYCYYCFSVFFFKIKNMLYPDKQYFNSKYAKRQSFLFSQIQYQALRTRVCLCAKKAKLQRARLLLVLKQIIIRLKSAYYFEGCSNLVRKYHTTDISLLNCKNIKWTKLPRIWKKRFLE